MFHHSKKVRKNIIAFLIEKKKQMDHCPPQKIISKKRVVVDKVVGKDDDNNDNDDLFIMDEQRLIPDEPQRVMRRSLPQSDTRHLEKKRASTEKGPLMKSGSHDPSVDKETKEIIKLKFIDTSSKKTPTSAAVGRESTVKKIHKIEVSEDRVKKDDSKKTQRSKKKLPNPSSGTVSYTAEDHGEEPPGLDC